MCLHLKRLPGCDNPFGHKAILDCMHRYHRRAFVFSGLLIYLLISQLAMPTLVMCFGEKDYLAVEATHAPYITPSEGNGAGSLETLFTGTRAGIAHPMRMLRTEVFTFRDDRIDELRLYPDSSA